MLPADMTGGASPSTAADLKVGADVLMTFKQRIDKLLSEFEDSAGSASKVGAHRVSRTSLSGHGSPFHEADALFTQYEQVHEHITQLSKTLGLQIEAMGIATQGAQNGFDGLDDDQRRRFWEIQIETDRLYSEAQQEKSGEGEKKLSDAKKSTKGLQ
ncbi:MULTISPECIES: hypothetical protein [Streptomyces]|uniref:hypothetical protein n=1 Tax=Streptomyces TaxID=1883 RepID=UPI0015E6611A|nr:MULTISPECIES: hypothetical protein [Streptomyces]MCX5352447.1 hypothetical protein [Streptomyces mirabilis]